MVPNITASSMAKRCDPISVLTIVFEDAFLANHFDSYVYLAQQMMQQPQESLRSLIRTGGPLSTL